MSDQEPLEQSVRGWIEKQGYPLEMRTAAAFRAHGITVRQAQHFLDPDTGKSREIDIACLIDDRLGVASLRLVVECKASSKPWVVFSSAHTLSGYNRLFALGVLSGSLRGALVDSISDLERLAWFKKDGRVGFATAQAFSEGSDLPFAAVMSAIKACLWQHSEDASYRPPLLGAFPVVVVDAPLFECYLDDGGDTQLSPVAAIDYFVGVRMGSFGGTCVRIVSSQELIGYCVEAKRELSTLLQILEPAIQAQWSDLKARTSMR